jgi:hypothetical protein
VVPWWCSVVGLRPEEDGREEGKREEATAECQDEGREEMRKMLGFVLYICIYECDSGPRRAGGIFGPLHVSGHRAEDAAQARPDRRAGLAHGTIPSVLGRVRVVLFRAVPVPAHRAWPIWTSIVINSFMSEWQPHPLPWFGD